MYKIKKVDIYNGFVIIYTVFTANDTPRLHLEKDIAIF